MNNSNNSIGDFNEFAEDYRRIHTQNVQGMSGADSDYFSEYKILEIKEEVEGKKILDFGCGDGNSAFFISKNISSYQYSGIDVSVKSIEKACSRNIPNCKFQYYDGTNIPFEDDTFDVVFAACVFHHIDEEKHLAALKEIFRVLKKNGKLIVFEHNPYNPFTLKAVHDCPFDIGVKLISASKMKKKIRTVCFSINKKCSGYTLFFPRKGIFKKMLCFEKKLKWCPIGAQYYVVGVKK